MSDYVTEALQRLLDKSARQHRDPYDIEVRRVPRVPVKPKVTEYKNERHRQLTEGARRWLENNREVRAARRKRHTTNLTTPAFDEKICAREQCGRAFEPSHMAQRYCRTSCQLAARSLRRYYRLQAEKKAAQG